MSGKREEVRALDQSNYCQWAEENDRGTVFEAARNSLGKIVSRKQDLRFEQLRIFYEEAGFSLNENFASNLEMLADSDKYNYIAYLLSDINSTSIKVAKYASLSRTDLIENNEYGYACLIRAAKRVLGFQGF